MTSWLCYVFNYAFFLVGHEVAQHAEILINSERYNVSDNYFLGTAPLMFKFSIATACIPAPDIILFWNFTSNITCSGTFSCSYEFIQPAEVIHLTITVGTINVPYPVNGNATFTIGCK